MTLRIKIGRSLLRFLLLVVGISITTIAIAHFSPPAVILLMGLATGISLWRLWEERLRQTTVKRLSQQKDQAIADLQSQLNHSQLAHQSSLQGLENQSIELQERSTEIEILEQENLALQSRLEQEDQFQQQLLLELEKYLQATPSQSETPSTGVDLASIIAALELQNIQLQEETRRLSSKIETLKYQFAKVKKPTVNQNHDLTHLQNLLIQLIIDKQSPTLEQDLKLIEGFFPERIVVLETAWKSAKESESFKDLDKAFVLLWKLATQYWELRRCGKGDVEAKEVFGKNAYAARESESVERNERARRLRTFEYNGESIVMFKHLKIGRKDSVSETLRIHFEWDSTDSKIIIGHCGSHLDHD